MSVPSTMIDPRSGRSRPISDFKKTDLPVPEGPSRTLTSPSGISIVTSSQIRWDPKDFVSPSTEIPLPMRNPPTDVAVVSVTRDFANYVARVDWSMTVNQFVHRLQAPPPQFGEGGGHNGVQRANALH